MAARKKTGSKSTVSRSKAGMPMLERIRTAALAIASADGWSAVSTSRLATDLGVPLGQIIAVCPTRSRVAALLFQQINQGVLSEVQRADDLEIPRDRLSDVMMKRFDVLQSDRAGYESLIRYTLRQPLRLACRAPAVVHSMALMLIAAGIGAEGLLGAARAHALAVAYGSIIRVWLKDDSADMAQTMSALDKALGRLEKIGRATSGRWGAQKSDIPKDAD